MTVIEEQALKLSRTEKISLMERLWSDLTGQPDHFEIPAWHVNELEETERNLSEGKERFLDWDEVKRELRNA